MKGVSLFACFWCLLFAGCRPYSTEERFGQGSAASETAVLTQVQDPWQLSIECLPEQQLLSLAREGGRTPVNPSLTTVAVKLRIRGQHTQATMTELLARQAPHYSAAQAQDALFYHMAEAGFLQVQQERVYPKAAYTEMTTQREQSVELVFVFNVPRRAIVPNAEVKFILNNAFFLTQPIEFAVPATYLFPAA